MASAAGSPSDLHASEKIVALMEDALKVKAK
jgi:UDP-N-acetylglucosamine--N-acetylmuramyl-(pentapeptide) pyrophosphoryl-undecaprenol N-acetylglucosamine transferase